MAYHSSSPRPSTVSSPSLVGRLMELSQTGTASPSPTRAAASPRSDTSVSSYTTRTLRQYYEKSPKQPMFTPSVNPRSEKLTRRRNTIQSVFEWNERKEANLGQLRQRQESRPASRDLPRRMYKGNSTLLERHDQWVQQRKEKMERMKEQLAQEEMEEVRSSPQITRRAQHLVRNYEVYNVWLEKRKQNLERIKKQLADKEEASLLRSSYVTKASEKMLTKFSGGKVEDRLLAYKDVYERHVEEHVQMIRHERERLQSISAAPRSRSAGPRLRSASSTNSNATQEDMDTSTVNSAAQSPQLSVHERLYRDGIESLRRRRSRLLEQYQLASEIPMQEQHEEEIDSKQHSPVESPSVPSEVMTPTPASPAPEMEESPLSDVLSSLVEQLRTAVHPL